MSESYKPYTYLIGWSHLQKYYYGVRFAKKTTPEDFWVTYFTSSKEVDKYRKLHGEPDILQVRKVFNTREDAIRWEQRVLQKLNVLKEEKWLNKCIGQPTFLGKKHSKQTIDKLKKPKPEGFGDKVRAYHKGKKRSIETKSRISKSKSGVASRSKICLFENNGKTVEIYNLKKYCRENNLNISCMSDVYYGRQKQHKNFRKVS